MTKPISYNSLNERFNEVAAHAPLSVAEATVDALESFYATDKEARSRSQAASVVLARAIKALAKAVKEAPGLEGVAAASSDLEVILALLSTPEVAAELKCADPLAPAKLRGLEAMEDLLQARGGAVSGEAAAKLLGLKRQSVDKARQEGRLLAFPRGQKKFLYPVWQFDQGRVLPGLKEVYASLPPMGPWMKASFMLSANTRLNEKSPLDLLLLGKAPLAVKAAKAMGEHGAA